MPDPKALLDQTIAITQKAIALGVAVETALVAFREKLFPSFGADGPSSEAFGTLPSELQADILDAVDACQG